MPQLYRTDSWYPPGHGDFYYSFYNSGLMTELVDQGREFVFMSNIDNMGATVCSTGKTRSFPFILIFPLRLRSTWESSTCASTRTTSSSWRSQRKQGKELLKINERKFILTI